MRNSILAMIVIAGSAVAFPATAQQQPQAAPSELTKEQIDKGQKTSMPTEEVDKGIKTRNSGASGYVGEQDKPAASADPPGRPNTQQTTGGQQAVGNPPAANPPQLPPVQPERSPRQAEQSRDQERKSAEDVQVRRDWRVQRDGDRMGQRRMGRMYDDDDDSDHRTVGRNWRMQRDYGRGYYDEDRPRTRVKICTEYENGDEVCRYRN